MQYRELNILKTIAKPIGDLVRFDDPNSLNGMAIRVLIEVDARFPLKRALVVNRDKELPTFHTYEDLFKLSSYCGRRMLLKCDCDVKTLDASWFMVNKVSADKPNMLSKGFNDQNLTLADLDKNLIICFPQPPRAITYGAHSRGGPKVSEKTVSWDPRKRRRENEGDSEGESEGEVEGAGPGARGGDSLGKNN
ncbi:hypothetical protein D8674_018983 [Pyrus ussuriensis x Pyrus communis]|uniref:Uncharacterized protein n=1 Tax=Pyrus ussuriensis x Pyrus communis TaxID=2448454 RepID=A0A5N5GB20_9ROSA|nr:hypothetical protein D8674_018983 [Pyrus ussuriensis x Pyrus communis]